MTALGLTKFIAANYLAENSLSSKTPLCIIGTAGDDIIAGGQGDDVIFGMEGKRRSLCGNKYELSESLAQVEPRA